MAEMVFVSSTLTIDRRIELIKDIIKRLKRKGRREAVSEGVTRFEAFLPYCSLEVLTLKGTNPAVQIAENFGDPNFVPRSDMDRSYYGLRKVYRGSYRGLTEIGLEGITMPNLEGLSLLPAQSLLRSKESKGNGRLTLEDEERFDAFLRYVQREL